jgi:predicted DNA-binding transcriptional regulator YafY
MSDERRADDPIVDLATHEAKTVTARQIANYCDVSLQTVYKWIVSGQLQRTPHFTREIRIKTDGFRMFVLRLNAISIPEYPAYPKNSP